MRVIKPGKLGVKTGAVRTGPSGSGGARQNAPAGSSVEIWDDFVTSKKGKRRKEYERGTSATLLPRVLELKPEHRGDAPPAEGQIPEEMLPRQSARPDYALLEDRLGYAFTDRLLLERALTHRSALGLLERTDYERLEFLGDAVLDLSVAHLLSDRHLEAREGELSKMRAALVNTQALASIARALSLGPYIRLGRGEFSSGGNERPSILADVMEAVIGAIYRDSNYERAMAVIESIFGPLLDKVTPFDPKTELQEALHSAGSEPPSYLLEMVEGPEHAPTFVTVVMVDGEVAGRGRGTTKKAAQQSAAAEALGKMFRDNFDVALAEGQMVISPQAFIYPRRPEKLYDQTAFDVSDIGGGVERESTEAH
jgi:ribonuclease-3